jgi:hypothetical protein
VHGRDTLNRIAARNLVGAAELAEAILAIMSLPRSKEARPVTGRTGWRSVSLRENRPEFGIPIGCCIAEVCHECLQLTNYYFTCMRELPVPSIPASICNKGQQATDQRGSRNRPSRTILPLPG